MPLTEKLVATVDDDQHAFVFEEVQTGIAAIKAQVTKGGANPDGKRAPRPRKGFAPHLERVEVVIEPEELPEYAGKQKILIGEGYHSADDAQVSESTEYEHDNAFA